MATDEIKALYHRVVEEIMNRHSFQSLDELIALNYVNGSWPMPVPGREGFKQVLSMFFTAFPDMQVTVDDVVAEGHTVTGRGTWHGTHRGDFMGIPATGKQVEVPFMDFWSMEQGRFSKNWVQQDILALLQQLGAIPALEGARG
ncbi:MAG: hypothetical protein NVS2B7_00850 [Herpetosiphon sp.]